MSLKDEVAVVGVAVARAEGADARLAMSDLAIVAANAALADAGLDRADVRGFCSPSGVCDHGALANQMGVPEVSFSATLTSGSGGGAGALALAAAAVSGGFADVVVSLTQYQSAPRDGGTGPSALFRPRPGAAASAYGLSGGPGPDGAYSAPAALRSYGAAAALTANAYLQRYGITREDVGRWVVQARANAGEKLALDTYLAAPIVVDPFSELDAAPGIATSYVSAVVTASVERARDLDQPLVLISGAATGGTPISGAPWQGPAELVASSGHRDVADDVYGMAGASASDVDVALFADDFSPWVLMQLEDYGFCDRGEGGAFVADGRAVAGGTVAVNTHGGNITDAFARSVSHVDEAVRQLRGTASNQVPDASTALVTGDPGTMPLSAVIMRRA